MRMELVKSELVLPILLFVLIFASTSSENIIVGGSGGGVDAAMIPEYIQNFGNFTDQLIHVLEVSEPTEHRPGVHMYTPFSIGYLLANVYERLWPIPVKEIPESIFTLKKYVATDYAALLRLFKKRKFRVSSTIFSRFGNVTKPPTFPQLLTQVISLDLQKNRTEFRQSLREILERGTKGHLANEMLPKKDPAWREIFDKTTHGVYVNTLHYKANWDKPWKNIGEKKVFDNARVPFIEQQGEYLYAEANNASAVIINLQGSTKQIILFKPHDFTGVTDMRQIIRDMLNNHSLWRLEHVTIQMPALNVTNLSQPSDKFPFIGVTDTFCRGRYMDPSQFYYNQHPIAHANHFQFSPDFLEIASTSGSLLAYQNNKDFLPKPPANQSVHHGSSATSDVDYFDILEASEEEDKMFDDYIVEIARSDLPFQKRFRGVLTPEIFKKRKLRENTKGVNPEESSLDDLEECAPILTDDEYLPSNMMNKSEEEVDVEAEATTTAPLLVYSNETVVITVKKEERETEASLPLLSPPPSLVETSTMKLLRTDDDPGTKGKMMVLDTPFSWVLRDQEIGEVFYGSVSSLCLYDRAVRHIPTLPAWVLDLFKAFYWRCV